MTKKPNMADIATNLALTKGYEYPYIISYGDCDRLDDVWSEWEKIHNRKVKGKHPTARHASVLNALDRDPRWSKGYILAIRGMSRVFELKKEFRVGE